MNRYRTFLMICGGTGCSAGGGGGKLKDALETELKDRGIQDEFKVVMTCCNGFCGEGPIMKVNPDGIFYKGLKPENMATIAEEHLYKGKPVERHLYQAPGRPGKVPLMKDIPYFNLQVSRVMRNKGLIDPEKIEEYIARDGYQAAAKALTSMSPEEIIKTVKDSGLRGRGGANFPTGLKWELCAGAPSDEKYILCNGDEGDPGVFIDRTIMESDPHAVIEGMIIGAKAINAKKGYLYVRIEYFMAVSRMQLAIKEARENGLLGRDILGTGFDFDMEVFETPGAFVCGESTALMLTVEGKRGMPRPTPPNSVVKGLFGKPSVLNNVQTFANVPQIILNGADWFKEHGVEGSTGSRVFALTGSVNNAGLLEVPMGETLNRIVNEIGGGVKRGRKFKAIHLGGPSGGYLPEKFLDTPLTFEGMEEIGVMVGSGGVVVMDDLNCMVHAAKSVLEFTVFESCGKCPPCRIGSQVLMDIYNDITEGRGKMEDLDLIEELSDEMIKTSLCGLGQCAPKPVLTSLKYFREEYESHINEGWCKAGECRELVTFYIDEETCKGCGACKRVCPVEAITGEKKKPHLINQETCIKCRACLETCKFGSILAGPASMREELLNKKAVEA